MPSARHVQAMPLAVTNCPPPRLRVVSPVFNRVLLDSLTSILPRTEAELPAAMVEFDVCRPPPPPPRTSLALALHTQPRGRLNPRAKWSSNASRRK
jgi:hypothetical protein